MTISFQEAAARGWIRADEIPASARPNRARKAELEGEEQAQLIKIYRARYPQYAELLIHCPNGGSRKNAYEGWRLKEQGTRAGVSDLQLTVARGGFFGLWIEFKAAPPNNAPVSTSQQDWINRQREQGYRAELCLGVAAAMAVLDDYLAKPETKVLRD